ncbi:hypothetical protein [Halocatena halophila]|uniref:hypothetical protein n=1 Tax=Halocatena halophila TaxID=2814576 RepID=UPI002ED4A8BD
MKADRSPPVLRGSYGPLVLIKRHPVQRVLGLLCVLIGTTIVYPYAVTPPVLSAIGHAIIGSIVLLSELHLNGLRLHRR